MSSNVVVQVRLTPTEYEDLWRATPMTPAGTVEGVVRDRMGLPNLVYGQDRPTVSEIEYHDAKRRAADAHSELSQEIGD